MPGAGRSHHTPRDQPDRGAGAAAFTVSPRAPVAPVGVEDETAGLKDSQNALLALTERDRTAFLKVRFFPFPKLLRWPTAPFFVTARPLV